MGETQWLKKWKNMTATAASARRPSRNGKRPCKLTNEGEAEAIVPDGFVSGSHMCTDRVEIFDPLVNTANGRIVGFLNNTSGK
jgi:hypothetical protein